MYKRLYSFLHKFSVLYQYQFGFRQYHSTSLALIELCDSLYSHLDNHEFVIGMYFDFQKAFDTVDHKIYYKNFIVMVFVELFMTGFKIICQIVNNLFQSTIIVLPSPTLLVESPRVLFLALCCF